MAKIVKAKAVGFKIHAPQAKKVSVVGSFNNWKTSESPAKKDKTGVWTAKVSLKPGRYEYKFFMDGNWMPDPKCANKVNNGMGSENSVIEVK